MKPPIATPVVTGDYDPLALNDAIQRSVGAWRKWRWQLKTAGGSDLDPFLFTRWAVGQSAFSGVAALPEAEPLRTPLLRWIERLAEQRINGAWLLRAADLYRRKEHATALLESGAASLHRSLLGAVSGKQTDAWFHALARGSGELGEVMLALWERRTEIRRRLGAERVLGAEDAYSASDELAARWLLETAPLAAESLGDFGPRRAADALGLEAADGWPPRLLPRTLLDVVDAPELFRGLELDPGPLPELLGPASFLRALARLGAAWADAAAPRHVPFVVAHDPYGIRRFTCGALFATLPWLEPFSRRLGLGASVRAKRRRALAKVLLVEGQHAAARCLLASAALRGRKDLLAAHTELTERLFGKPLPASTALIYLRPRRDSGARFLGFLLASERCERLTEAHDEDWFRNPRAQDELRSECGLVPDSEPPIDRARSGLQRLSAELTRALG